LTENPFFDYHLLGEYGVFSIIGFILIMDNFRVSIGLGILHLNRTQQQQIALSFGLFESIMPVVGVTIGNTIAILLGSWTDYLGAVTVGAYGIYLIHLARFREKDYITSDADRWLLLLVLPLSLSLDNLIAGISLGIVGIQLFPLAIIIGCITILTSLVGMRLGGIITKYLLYKANNVFCGILLIAVAVSLVVTV